MRVELQTDIENDPKRPAVKITASETVYAVESLDHRIKTLQVARAWLKQALEKK